MYATSGISLLQHKHCVTQEIILQFTRRCCVWRCIISMLPCKSIILKWEHGVCYLKWVDMLQRLHTSFYERIAFSRIGSLISLSFDKFWITATLELRIGQTVGNGHLFDGILDQRKGIVPIFWSEVVWGTYPQSGRGAVCSNHLKKSISV